MVRVAPFFDSQCILASGHQSARCNWLSSM